MSHVRESRHFFRPSMLMLTMTNGARPWAHNLLDTYFAKKYLQQYRNEPLLYDLFIEDHDFQIILRYYEHLFPKLVRLCGPQQYDK